MGTSDDELRKQINTMLNEINLILNPKQTIHYRIQRFGGYMFIFSIFLPLLFVVPMIVLTSYNQCLTYATTLYSVSVGLFSGMYVVAFIHNAIYNSTIEFCTELTRSNHLILDVALFSIMGALIGFLNLYSYSFELWYLMGGFACFFSDIFIYHIAFFQRHHVRTCSTPNAKHTINEKNICCGFSFEILFGVLLAFFLLLASGMIVVSASLGMDLYNDDRPRSWLIGCTNVTND